MPADATDSTKTLAADPERRPSSELSVNGSKRSNSAGSKDNKHHDSEPNPFERSFSGTGGNDGNKQVLPGVSNLTSPSLNHAGMSQAPGGWSSFGSLRNGPLSPAMLLGPSGLGGFDGTLRTGLTPNESSIRTGLTPRGDNWSNLGSPGAIFNHFGSTGLTPGGNLNFLSGPGGANMNDTMFSRPHPPSHLGQDNGLHAQNNNVGSNGQDADAANGLFLLSQHSQHQGPHHTQEDLMRQATLNNAKNAGGMPSSKAEEYDTSPTAARRARRKSSFADAGSPEDIKPAKKSKKASQQQQQQQQQHRLSDSGNESDGMDDNTESGKHETDEEKRKNFLERNRQAALKCRQRKKQWLQNLQAKVEFYGQENDQLTSQVTSLREEIVNLKTMLLAHKECPVARNNSIGGQHDMQQMQQGLQY